MQKKILQLLILSITFLAFSQKKAEAQLIIPSQEAYKQVSTNKLKEQVEFLSDSLCGGRGTGTLRMTETNFWISQRFRDVGLIPIENTFVHHFYTAIGPIGRNIIGFMPSNKSYCNHYTIVMAHYDGLGEIKGRYYPGADSNASGVVAMLSIADMFNVMRKYHIEYDGNIIFVATDGKGLNMIGAEDLFYRINDKCFRNPCTGEMITMDKISLVVNIDQIGSSLSPINSNDPNYIIMLGKNSLLPKYRNFLDICNDSYNLHLNIGYDYYGSKDFTHIFYTKICEQMVFVSAHIPSVLFTSGITLNNNKIEDKAISLNFNVLQKRIILIFRWLEQMIETNQQSYKN